MWFHAICATELANLIMKHDECFGKLVVLLLLWIAFMTCQQFMKQGQSYMSLIRVIQLYTELITLCWITAVIIIS